MAPRFKIRRTVLIPVRNGPAFNALYFSDGDVGGLRVPLTTGLSVGEACELEIAFAHERMVFNLRGVARWRRPHSAPDLPSGVGIGFAPGEERTRDLLLSFARGNEVSLVQREDRRFPVEIPLICAGPQGKRAHTTDNLSAGGAFIIADPPYDLGSELQLTLKPPGYLLGITLLAEVVWHRRHEPTGVGVRFVKMTPSTRKKLTQLLERVKEAMAVVPAEA